MGSSSVRAEEENNKDSSTTGDEAAATQVPWKRMWKAAAEDSPFLQGIDAALPDRLSQILNGGGSQQRDLTDILANIRDRSGSEQGVVEDTASSSSLLETLSLLDQYREDITAVVAKYFGGDAIILNRLVAPAFFYFLEAEDSIKTPSWKRRTHRFCRGVEELEMNKLNEALELARLSYADTRQGIDDALTNQGYNVIFCSTRSEPGKPAHFVAVRQVHGKPQVILVVRGSKTTADTITDLLCDPVNYRGGKAHSFILESGRYIAKKHQATLERLSRELGPLEVTVVGHSLGAGAATIAGIELNDDPRLHVNVVGFGGPALLSQQLAESTASFVTTIINDDDVVPRLSGAAVANLLMDISEFDWIPYAQKDVDFALSDHATGIAVNAPDVIKHVVAKNAGSLLQSLQSPPIAGRKERLEIELFPPGKLIHFYRDGVGLSGCVVPNTFFTEIDVSRSMVAGGLVRVNLDFDRHSPLPLH